MKIYKKSWHYRWLIFVSNSSYDIPNNLCAYFWTVVLVAPLKFLLIVTMLIAAITALVIFPLLLIPNIWFSFLSPKIIFFSILLSFPAGFIAFFLLQEQARRNGYIDKTRFPNMRPPGLLTSYIKAKKKKYCPMLTFHGGKYD
jgi:signal transduction histidine kinase